MASSYALKQPELALDRERLDHQRSYNWAQLGEQKRHHDMQSQRASADAYGKAGTIVQGPDGGFYSVQFGSNGRKIVEPLMADGKPLVPAMGTVVVGDVIANKSTGQEIRNVGGNIAGAEQAKVEGREAGEKLTGFSKAQAALSSANAKTDLVERNLAEAEKLIGGTTTGAVGAVTRMIPGTSAYDLKERIKTVLANSGFDELQTMRDNSPTGGALGQVAVQELEMLQKIRGSLEQAQSEPQLRAIVQEYKQFLKESRQRRQEAFRSTFGNMAVPVVRSPDPAPAGRASAAPAVASPEAVAELRKNTSAERRRQFDEIFGPGAAARALSGGR